MKKRCADFILNMHQKCLATGLYWDPLEELTALPGPPLLDLKGREKGKREGRRVGQRRERKRGKWKVGGARGDMGRKREGCGRMEGEGKSCPHCHYGHF